MAAIGADEKKKLYILLGLAGVLGAVVLLVIKPFGRGSGSKTTTTTAVSTAASPTPSSPSIQPVSTTSSGPPPIGGPAGGAALTGGTGSGTAQLIPLGRYRPNPFAPKVAKAGAPLPPPKPPPKPRPTPRPLPPVFVPSPGDISLAPAPINGPQQGASGGQLPSIAMGLPPVSISQFNVRTSPRPAVALGAVGGVAGGSGSPVIASDKRLAGVVIGDSVRALIEINDGNGTITQVVKPGDEVAGIKILSIDRITENGAIVTRMTVLENGQERYFDLRPASGR